MSIYFTHCAMFQVANIKLQNTEITYTHFIHNLIHLIYKYFYNVVINTKECHSGVTGCFVHNEFTLLSLSVT